MDRQVPQSPACSFFYFMQKLSRDTEVWADIPGFEGCYQIGSLGNLKSLARILVNASGKFYRVRERILWVGLRSGNNYIKKKLCKEGVMDEKNIHIMVARAFIPNPENKPIVNHMDGNKLNNAWWNLEWNTVHENNDHARKTGLNRSYGEDNALSLLTKEQVLEIVKAKGLFKDIGKKYGVCAGTIGEIKRGASWSHLTGIRYEKKQKRLSPEEVVGIFESKLKQRELSLIYGVTQEAISLVKRGISYSEITNPIKMLLL